jgi:hypothetical protein
MYGTWKSIKHLSSTGDESQQGRLLLDVLLQRSRTVHPAYGPLQEQAGVSVPVLV